MEEEGEAFRDLFRQSERSVKALMKSIETELDPKLRKKRRTRSGERERERERVAPLDWGEVVDVRSEASWRSLLVEKASSLRCLSPFDHECSSPGCVVFEWPQSGFCLVKNALCPAQQLRWAKICLEEYSRAEHTNLTNLAKINGAQSSSDSPGEDLWSRSLSENDDFHNFKKFRWSCLGYHYDWTTRSYQKNVFSAMPEDFNFLCRSVAQSVGFDLDPEAAIINYYPLNATMGGHIDDAEHDLDKPIVSFSLGRSALFLLGGKTKLTKPKAFLLSSGDAVVMAGESRTWYHGVPCILSDTAERFLTSRDGTEELTAEKWTSEPIFSDVIRYLLTNRVNMNSRQVRQKGTDEVWIDKKGTGCVKV